MEQKNQTPTPRETEAYIAKWEALGRIAVIVALPTIALIALLIKLSWNTLETTAPLLLIFFEIVLVVLISGGVIGLFLHFKAMHQAKLERYRHNTYRFTPDMIGNYEAVFDQAEKTFIQAAPGNMQEPVPQTYSPHYAPQISYSYEYKDESSRLLEEGKIDPAYQANLAPTIDEVVQILPRNGLQLCLGRSLTTSELLPIELPDSHIKLIGATRKGKSCLAAAILEQAQRTHDPRALQFALLDLEYKTSRLFEKSPHVAYLQAGRRGRVPAVARSAEEVATWLKYMYQEMDRRYKMTSQQKAQLPYIIVYLEEFLDLRRRLKGNALDEALDNFTSLAVRSLKEKIILMVCAQVDYASEELREAMAQFVGTNIAFSVNPNAARAAGFIDNDLLKKNYQAKTPGQFVVEATGINDLGISPQFNVKAKLEHLDGVATWSEKGVNTAYTITEIDEENEPAHPQFTPDSPPSLHPDETTWQAHIEDVLTLYNQGYKSIEILVEKVFGIKKGGYQKWYQARDTIVKCLEEVKRLEQKSEVDA